MEIDNESLILEERLVIKGAVSRVFNSIISRESNPTKRALLLERISSECQLAVSTESLLYVTACRKKDRLAREEL